MGSEQRTFDAGDLSRWTSGSWEGPPPRSITGISIDTRSLRGGDLYIAIRGDRFDGHAFIDDALRRGAAGVAADREFPGSVPGPCLRVSDTRRALSAMAGGHRATLGGLMVGITGSVGKTTVKELTAAMLAPLGSTAFTRGNWNNDLGLPLSLLEMGAADRFGVFEMGMNHPGELDPLCRLLAPAWGIMTPVGLAHSEAFACERDIVTEKASLFRALPEQGGAVLSRDQKWYAELAAEAGCPVVTTSLAGDADFRGRVVAPGRFEVTEAATSETASFDIPAPGRFMVENALLAIALARRLGGSWDALGAALAAYRPMPMRWEESSVGGARVINDAYNANPMSMRASADALAALTGGGRKWLVLAGMFELGSAEEAEHVELGRYLAGGPWAGLLVVGRLGGLIADGAEAAGLAPARVVRCGNHEEAAESLRAMVQAGDVVLLKGSRGEHLEHILEHFPADRQTS